MRDTPKSSQGFEFMSISRSIGGAVFALPLFLFACGGDASSFGLRLIHNDCDEPVGDTMPGSGTLQLTVTGPGMSPLRVDTQVGSGRLEVPEVPVGKDRVVTVEVFEAGSSGTLRSWGRSGPFEVTESGTPSITLVMNRANGFTRTMDEQGACSDLSVARAGHTATLLADGRVLIAGGFSSLATGAESGFIDSAEIFDPATGAFTKVDAMCDGTGCHPRAFAQAVALRDGGALVVGGVAEAPGQLPEAVNTALVYEPGGGWTFTSPMAHARRGHSATMIGANGKVMVIGGVDAEGKVVAPVEVFDPTVKSFSQQDLRVSRAFHGAVNFGTHSQAVGILGGIDAAGELKASVEAVNFVQATGRYELSKLADLPTAVAGAGIALFNESVAVVGGARTWTVDGGAEAGFGSASSASKQAQWFDRPEANKGNLPTAVEVVQPRINPCVVSPDGETALIVGGFTDTGGSHTKGEILRWMTEKGADDKSKRVLRSSLTERSGAMRGDEGRAYASCTDLGDGRVLVVGGIGRNKQALKTAEIYVVQPSPPSQ